MRLFPRRNSETQTVTIVALVQLLPRALSAMPGWIVALVKLLPGAS